MAKGAPVLGIEDSFISRACIEIKARCSSVILAETTSTIIVQLMTLIFKHIVLPEGIIVDLLHTQALTDVRESKAECL